jgi:hypothetical protein
MNAVRRLAWAVLMIAAPLNNVAMAQASAPEAASAAPAMASHHETERRKRDRDQCLSLIRDIRNVEHLNALLRQKEQLLETGVTSASAPPADTRSTAVCHSPSADLLANLRDQDAADWKLNGLLSQKVALLEKQAGTARK